MQEGGDEGEPGEGGKGFTLLVALIEQQIPQYVISYDMHLSMLACVRELDDAIGKESWSS